MVKKGLLIGEVASLFGLSIDTLRYYDRENLLKPIRDPVNGYRYYTIHHISRLISILFLRKIDVPMKEIRESLDDYALSDTYHFLKEKKELIGRKIEHMKKLERMIDNQLKFIEHYSSGSREIRIENQTMDRSVFFIVKDLEKKTLSADLSLIYTFLSSSEPRAIPEEWFLSGRFGCYYDDFTEETFHLAYYLDGYRSDADIILPRGDYASYLYSGDEENPPESLLDKLAKRAGQSTPVLEIWQIDEYHSRRKRDFITEYQIPMK